MRAVPGLARWRAAMLVACLAFGLAVFSKWEASRGLTRFLGIGENWVAAHPLLPEVAAAQPYVRPGSHGYDGVQYVQLAVSPSLEHPGLDKSLDAPAYRARRIGMPALGWLVAAGDPWFVVYLYPWLNVGFWFVLAWQLARRVESDAEGFARWFCCLFSMGVLESVRYSLSDLPALVMLVAMLSLYESRRVVSATGVFALALLTRETSLLATPALAGSLRRRELGRSAVLVAAAVLPMTLWFGYVTARFGGGSAAGSGNFSLPFMAMGERVLSALAAISRGDFDGRYVFGIAAVFATLLQVGVFWGRCPRTNALWRAACGFTLLAVCLGPAVWHGYWAVCRSVLPLLIAYNLLLPSGRWFWPLLAAGNVTLLHAVWRFL